MTKKLRLSFIMILLALLSCLCISTAFAKYSKEIPLNDDPFNVTINASEPQTTAFAVYSETDDSFNFYNRETVPKKNESFENKQVSMVFEGVDKLVNTSNTPWSSLNLQNIQKVEFIDEIAPKSTAYWFAGFANCTNFNFDKLDTSNVTDMECMFLECSAVEVLDLSKFNTAIVEKMEAMFMNCVMLKTIYASDKFVTTNLNENEGEGMFFFCSSLKGGNATTCDGFNNNNSDYARIDGLNGEPGYFTCKHNLVDNICSICGKQVVKDKPGLEEAMKSGKPFDVQGGEYEEVSIKADGVAVTVNNAVLKDVVGATSLIASSEGGILTVKYAEDTTNPNRAGLINAQNNGTVIINDGIYSAQALAMGNSTGKVIIKGGKFTVAYINGVWGMMQQVGSITIYGGIFNINPSSYVAEGYTVIEITEGEELYAKGYRYQVVPIS